MEIIETTSTNVENTPPILEALTEETVKIELPPIVPKAPSIDEVAAIDLEKEIFKKTQLRATLYQEVEELSKRRNILVEKIILHNKMLDATKWVLDWWGGKLALLAPRGEAQIRSIVHFAEKNMQYHSSYNITPTVTLTVADRYVVLIFADHKQIKLFAVEHNLTVDTSKMDKYIQTQTEELNLLKDWS